MKEAVTVPFGGGCLSVRVDPGEVVFRDLARALRGLEHRSGHDLAAGETRAGAVSLSDGDFLLAVDVGVRGDSREARAREAFARYRAAGGLGPPPAPPWPSFGDGWRPVAFFGALQLYRDDNQFALTDGSSEAFINRGTRHIHAAIPHDQCLPPRSGAGMEHLALWLLCRDVGLFDIHASVTVVDGTAFIGAGPTGSGKTTLALAMVAGGARCLGDDRVLVGWKDSRVALWAYPRAFHVASATAALVPRAPPEFGFAERASLGVEEKRPVDFGQCCGPALLSWTARTVILLPEVTLGRRTRIEPAERGEALSKLADGAAFGWARGLEEHATHFALLEALCRQSRCFHVRLGEDLLADPADVARTIARAAA